jgi:signal transduction histidine kinase
VSQHNLNPSEISRNTLTRNFAVLAFVITTLHFVLVLLLHIEIYWFAFISLYALSITIYTLVKLHYYTAAKTIGLIVFNFIIFWVAYSESLYSGLSLHFITSIVATGGLFGLAQRKYAIALVILSLALFAIVCLRPIELAPYRSFTDRQLKTVFILNFLSCTTTLLYTIGLLSTLNHRAEKKIIDQNIKLQLANEDLDKFVHRVSHDLRSPVNSLRSLLEVMQYTNSGAQSIQYRQLMESKLNSLDQYVKDLADYARAGQTEVRIEKVDLHTLSETVVANLQQHTQANIVFDIVVPPKMYITSDALQLQIILNNLVSNAIKYRDLTKSETRIEIAATREADNQICLCVKDNGQGIREEQLPKIFDKYYRSENQNSIEGMGLGLHLVKESVHKLKGNVEVNSEFGSGSSFTVYLPC